MGRDLTPFMQKLRNALLWTRTHKNNVRFRESQSVRDQPQPNIPTGPHDKLSANYYSTRDARREVRPPKVIYIGGQQALTSGQASSEAVKSKFQPKSPGFGYTMEEGVKEYKDKM